MPRLFYLLLMLLGEHVTARAVSAVAKREVLNDLSGGFCRNWKFGATIANEVLYLNGLDGGIIPGDNNGSNNYLVELDLSTHVNLLNGANYKLSQIPPDVPKLKDQAFWSNRANTTLFSYGGRGANDTLADNEVWTYNISDGSWHIQKTSVKPVRLLGGAYVDAPESQAAFWIGGYQSRDTTSSITDETKTYSTGMIQFNTTTEEFSLLESPFTPVQEGALVYLPVGGQGVLIFFGGEVPSIQDGIDAELTPNAWNYVQIYDIKTRTWYNQTTAGNVTPRTQFCASVVHDPSTATYQIYVISGADFETRDIITDAAYLSVPAFKWYSAPGLNKGRMSHTCLTHGRQIFGIGGRQAWADNSSAGCYNMPTFIYDAQTEVVRNEFNPGLSSYSVPSATSSDIANSPYPSVWADTALADIFYSPTLGNRHPTDDWPISNPTNKGAIAGGVVGGVAGAAIIVGLIWFFIRWSRRKAQQEDTKEDPVQAESKPKCHGLQELPANHTFVELEGGDSRTELQGDSRYVQELNSSMVDGQRK
ncbi:hypothetical protein BJX76DRAFT_369608 [Aspergillus varians]